MEFHGGGTKLQVNEVVSQAFKNIQENIKDDPVLAKPKVFAMAVEEKAVSETLQFTFIPSILGD